jgi:hypothetical protein
LHWNFIQPITLAKSHSTRGVYFRAPLHSSLFKESSFYSLVTMAYEVYYWGACEKFYGRALSVLLILEETGTKYVIKDQAHKPEGTFALPAIKTPSGVVVSQSAAICHVLGHELNLAPTDAAADAKALQICCDAIDFITEATKPDFATERKQKWLTHFASVTSVDAPVNYGDFLLFTALELAISAFTAAIDESEYPAGLGKWWNKMLATKAVTALKGKGRQLMPGEANKAW